MNHINHYHRPAVRERDKTGLRYCDHRVPYTSRVINRGIGTGTTIFQQFLQGYKYMTNKMKATHITVTRVA